MSHHETDAHSLAFFALALAGHRFLLGLVRETPWTSAISVMGRITAQTMSHSRAAGVEVQH
jgi:hypothetical protein